jgi:hypothetical protein
MRACSCNKRQRCELTKPPSQDSRLRADVGGILGAASISYSLLNSCTPVTSGFLRSRLRLQGKAVPSHINTESHRIWPEGASFAESVSNSMSRTWRGWGWFWTIRPTWQQVFRLGDSQQIWRDLLQQILLRHATSQEEEDWRYGPTCQRCEVSSRRVRTLATPAVHAVGLVR